MTRDEVRNAYKAFNRASREAFRLQQHLREADELIARFKVRQREALITEWVNALQNDVGFLRVLRTYTGHTPHGWTVACGCDGRMKKLLKDPGWDLLKEIIRRVRWRKYAPKGELHSGGRTANVTVEIKIDGDDARSF